MNCNVSGATNNGVNSSYGSTLEIDNCVIHDNFRGAVAANNASLIVTNSTSRDNTIRGSLPSDVYLSGRSGSWPASSCGPAGNG